MVIALVKIALQKADVLRRRGERRYRHRHYQA